MNTRMKQIANSTLYCFNELAYYAAPSIGASIAKYVGIETTRELEPSDLKDTIKAAFAKTAGGVNAALLSHSLMPSLSVTIQAWPYLTKGQKMLIATCTLVGLGGGLYSLGVMAQEKQTMTAGGMTSLSNSLFRVSQEAACALAAKNQKDGIVEAPLLEEGDVKGIRPFGR